jgi:hypothetical protein
MKKKIFSFVLFAALSGSMFAQDGAKKIGANPDLQQITVLKDKAAAIAAAETAAATTSRANAAAAQDKITALYADYTKELENQKKIHAKEAKTVAAIDAELKLINTKK